MKKVFAALSGGVDSSVAAALLQKRGFAVLGIHIRCYNVDGCGERDAADARRVAQHLKIPFYVFDFEEDYKRQVVDYMVDGYRRGLTPNPDVMCNQKIKFGLFLKRALELGADCITTGHYALLKKAGSVAGAAPAPPVFRLLAAKDQNKDQSYFLWTLTQERLKRCLFPIGEYTKPRVRAMAKKFGLPTAEKKDSRGICFLGNVTLADFLKDYIPEERGLVLTIGGEPIGEHRGAHYYTIGQRHGLAIGGFEKPLYVVQKDINTNTVFMAEGKNNPTLYKRELNLTNVNFINPALPSLIRANGRIDILARVRYRQPLAKAALAIFSNAEEYVYGLTFEHPQKFVAPGQSAVFYSASGELLGGGVICG